MPDACVFVYGTLQPGQSHFHLLASEVVEHEPATVVGWLFVLDHGRYPALVLPDYVEAVPNRLADPPGDVHGFLCRLRDPLPTTFWHRLDRYEGCTGDESGLYWRVQVSARTSVGTSAATTYVWNPRQLKSLLSQATLSANGRFGTT